MSTDFTDYFPQLILRNLPLSDLFNRTDPSIVGILNNLIENLEIEDDDEEESSRRRFDVGDFVEDLLDAVFDGIADNLRLSGRRVRCIVRVLRELRDPNVVGRLSSLLQRIRRGITALMRISRFLEERRRRLDFSILDQCVTRFIELSYCQRCTERTPPLCFSTCNAVARACYSPYFTVLNGQYRELWDRAQAIVEILNGTLRNLYDEEGALLDIAAVVSSQVIQCLGVSVHPQIYRVC